MTTVHQRGLPRVYLWTGRRNEERIDLSGDVISFRCSKSLDAPAGSWELQLLPRQGNSVQSVADVRRAAALYRAIEPNHVVSIGMDTPGGIMVGLVDRVAKTRDPSGPQVAATLTVSGRDLGKLLIQDDLIHAAVTVDKMAEFRAKVEAGLGADHPLLVDLLGVWGPIGRDGTPAFEGRSVQDVVDFILDHAGSMELPGLAAAYGRRGRAAEIIGTSGSVTTWDDARIYHDRPSTYEGDLWGMLWTVLDRVFYEARVDSKPRDGNAAPDVELIIRPRPFDEEMLRWTDVSEETGLGWDDLRNYVDGRSWHEVPEHEVLAESLGVDDAQATGMYLTTSEHDLIGNPSSLHEGLYYPLVDTFSARRFGLRSMQASLSLIAADYRKKVDEKGVADVGGLTEEVRDKRNRLFHWHRLLPWMERGSLRVAGRDSYRVGDRVFLPWAVPKLGSDLGLHFYCTGASWSWTFGGPYTTTLTLDRGHNKALVDEVKRRIREEAPAASPDHFAES